MSLFEPLLRLIDPIEYRRRVADRERARDPRPDQPDPEVTAIVPASAASAASRRRCRVCGHVDEAAYCLVCLADTMEDVR